MLVDTSVWIDHLRHDRSDLRARLDAGDVACHPFIIGELACGTLRRSDELFSLLSALAQVLVASHDEVMALVHRYRLMGTGLGWIDAHLLTSARLSGETLWTLDAKLERAATLVGVSPDR